MKKPRATKSMLEFARDLIQKCGLEETMYEDLDDWSYIDVKKLIRELVEELK